MVRSTLLLAAGRMAAEADLSVVQDTWRIHATAPAALMQLTEATAVSQFRLVTSGVFKGKLSMFPETTTKPLTMGSFL